LLLDLDGTLIHSEPVAARSLVSVMARHGCAVDLTHADAVIGRTWKAAFEILERSVRFPIPSERLLEEVLADYRVRLANEVGEVPGAVAAIRRLAPEFRLAVVSGSFRDEIESALQKLGIRDQMQFILGAEDYPRSKPSPDGYQLALKRLGVDAKAAVVFEDSEAGIASGLAAGARVVTVTHCGSLPVDSEWAGKSHARIVDWSGVSGDWIRGLRA
jgi:HAD superfamily hydrolase (TIGR01549 family)